MKKILYVHHGDINGGAPRSLKFLVDKLDKSKYAPCVVCRAKPTDVDYYKAGSVDTIFEPRIKPFHGSTVSGIDWKQIGYNFFYALPTFFAMHRIVKKINPQIVHLNSTCLFMCAAAVKSINKNIKVVCHVREPLLPSIWGKILKVMNNRFCDCFISIDEFDGRSVDPNLKKTTVIYNFVDFTQYNSDIQSHVLRDELGLAEKDTIYLALARLSSENGVFEAINKWVVNARQDQHLVIVGEIPGRELEYSSKCHAIADKMRNIHILPFRKDVPNVIASSDAIICTFTQPHFARAIIEGAAMGKAAISVNIDGPKELIIANKTGLFYEKDDDDLFRRQITVISDEPILRKKLGRNAEEFAKENFNSEINADKTFRMYEE